MRAPVIPTPGLRAEQLQTDDVVRFQLDKIVVEGPVQYLNGAGATLSVVVNHMPIWIPVSMCQLVEGAWGRPINHLVPWTSTAVPGTTNYAEITSVRSALDSSQIELHKLRSELNIAQDDLRAAERRQHSNYDSVCAERDSLAAELKEVLA